jgi:hypothetical protein
MDKSNGRKDWAIKLIVVIIVSIIYLTFFGGVNKFKNDIIGKAVERACREDWMCGEWSDCEEGLQYRDCIDMNNCFTEIKKPEEIKICSDNGELLLSKLGMGFRGYMFEETIAMTLTQVALVAAIVSLFSSLAFTLISKEISSRKHEKEKEKNEINDLSLTRLANYIQRELNCGYSKSHVVEKLMSEGWNRKSIDNAFLKVKIPKKDKGVLLENRWEIDLSRKIEEEFKSYSKK